MVYNMKKFLQILFCVIFFGVCSFFSIGMLIPDSTEAASATEALPELVSENGVNHSFGDELEEWFSENFAFRDTVVDMYSEIKLQLFSEGNSQVIAGKDDFLFFAETLDSYVGTNPMTDEEISLAANTLSAVRDDAEAAGAKFLFVCAPNKNTIYADMMPNRYQKSDEPTELDRLQEELSERGIEFVDLRPVLTKAADSELVYHKRDSHWNGVGALLAYSEIADALGITVPDLSDRGPVLTNDFEGDLDALLFPGETRYDSDVTYDFDGMYIYTSAYATPMDITITARGGREGRMLVFRDSFANALIPYMAASTAEIRFERTVPYNTELAESMDADYVIVEIAERNLRDLIDYAPSGQK